jgi:thioredoxin reductase
MADQSFEILVIGGGPAGLSAALYLARYDRRVVLFDAGQGRSTWHQIAYNYLGFPVGSNSTSYSASRAPRRRRSWPKIWEWN